jgi:uncharacterized C2H2 Zn-finger protein
MTDMALKTSWECPWPGCNVVVADKKNKSRHLDKVHGQERRSRGRPRKTIACRTEIDYQTDDSQRASHDQPCELQPHSHQTLPVRHPLNEWYIHQPWYQEIHGKQYHWNRNLFLEKLLRLPRLEDEDAPSEHALASIIKASDLPSKSEADALRALRDRE